MKTLSRHEPWNSKVDKHFYTAMVKVGEKYVASAQVLRNFLSGLVDLADRARLIFVPKGEAGLGLLTVMQKPLLRRLKRICPWFCHSVSCTEMAENIEKNLKRLKNPLSSMVALCADGSNHDGHQDLSLIKAVDFRFFKELFNKGWLERTLSKYTYDRACVRSVLDIPIFEETAKLTTFFEGERLNLRIRGTTFSGSPTRTTLGNTLRVFYYWSYLCSQCGLTVVETSRCTNKDVFIYVAGDDVVMWTDRANIRSIRNMARLLFSENKNDRHHGLGQCIEAIHERPWYDIDFCSKISTLYQQGNQASLLITRDPKKVLMHSTFHRYCAESGYMPPSVHSQYVGESILHELPGELMKRYGEYRLSHGNKLTGK